MELFRALSIAASIPWTSQPCLFPDAIFFSYCPSIEFHGLDEATLLRALQALQQEHKAEIITLDDGRGVKFF